MYSLLSAARTGAVMVAAIASAFGSAAPSAHASELPWWIDSIEVTPPSSPSGIGAVTLNGTWTDSAAPDAIGHSIRNGALHLSVSSPGLNVGTFEVLTPWTLTEEFNQGQQGVLLGPGGVNEIFGEIWSVDPRDRSLRSRVSGPDFLGWIVPPPRGSFAGLGTGDGFLSAAYDVSADGRVVSGANHQLPELDGPIASEAFVWTPETGRASIGHLPGGVPGGSRALGVSANGNYVAGVSSTGAEPSVPREAFRWSLGGGMEGLGTINEFSSTSEARALSHYGTYVVGTDEFFPPLGAPGVFDFRRAFRYNDRTGMQDLGVLTAYGDSSSTEGADISADGSVVVGTAYRGFNRNDSLPLDLAQPFRWKFGTMQGLGNLPRVFPAIFPTPQQETIANAVSADGETVVGVDRVIPSPLFNNFFSNTLESAVLWTREGGWIDLGELRLPPGPVQVAAEAVDVSGEGELVVGEALLVSTDALLPGVLDGEIDPLGRLKVPFIWDEQRGMRPLARVLAGDFGLDFEGWLLGEVTAISDDGTTVVGTGRNPDGVQEAWRAVMHRNSRPGDTDFDGDVDRNDHATLMRHLGMSSESHELYYANGDFDADGLVGEGDLALLLANYDGREFGDFNADGVIDAADYTVWRDNQGLETGIADSNGDGLASDADLVVWRANYGRQLNGAGRALAVPEPASLLLMTLGAASVAAVRKR